MGKFNAYIAGVQHFEVKKNIATKKIEKMESWNEE